MLPNRQPAHQFIPMNKISVKELHEIWLLSSTPEYPMLGLPWTAIERKMPLLTVILLAH